MKIIKPKNKQTMKRKGQICRFGALDLIATISYWQNRAVILKHCRFWSDQITGSSSTNPATLKLTATRQVTKTFCRIFCHGALRKKLPRVVNLCRLIVIGPHLLWDSRRLKWYGRDAWEPQGSGPTTNLCRYLWPRVRKMQQLLWHSLVNKFNILY